MFEQLIEKHATFKVTNKSNCDILIVAEKNGTKNIRLRLSFLKWFTDFTYESLNKDIEVFLNEKYEIKPHQIRLIVYENKLASRFK